MLLFSFSCGYKHVNENSTTAGPIKAVIGCGGSLVHLHTHRRSFGKSSEDSAHLHRYQ